MYLSRRVFHAANAPKISLGKFGHPNTANDPRKPPIIEDCVRTGENARLAPGVAEGALIDADCIIARNIPAGSHVRAGREAAGSVMEAAS